MMTLTRPPKDRTRRASSLWTRQMEPKIYRPKGCCFRWCPHRATSWYLSVGACDYHGDWLHEQARSDIDRRKHAGRLTNNIREDDGEAYYESEVADGQA